MANENQNPAPVFSLEKIYVRDISFEAPNSPGVFLSSQAPDVSVQLGVVHSAITEDQNLYEVVLSVTVTANHGDKNVFLAEAHQAGLFRIQNIPAEELPKVLEIACPNVLLPFVRQTVNHLVESGGFPQLLISPVNFEALYLQKQAAGSSPSSSH